jgi:hypothetical protein
LPQATGGNNSYSERLKVKVKGFWGIDRMEAQLFREVNGLPNVISNKAILNVACSMRNAWEIVE